MQAEINLAIARKCGWTDFVFRGRLPPHELDWIGVMPGVPVGNISSDVPNYYSSLDAMYEVEKILGNWRIPLRRGMKTRLYFDLLAGICVENPEGMHSTAPQRAEAFLRAYDLWKPEWSELDEENPHIVHANEWRRA